MSPKTAGLYHLLRFLLYLFATIPIGEYSMSLSHYMMRLLMAKLLSAARLYAKSQTAQYCPLPMEGSGARFVFRPHLRRSCLRNAVHQQTYDSTIRPPDS